MINPHSTMRCPTSLHSRLQLYQLSHFNKDDTRLCVPMTIFYVQPFRVDIHSSITIDPLTSKSNQSRRCTSVEQRASYYSDSYIPPPYDKYMKADTKECNSSHVERWEWMYEVWLDEQTNSRIYEWGRGFRGELQVREYGISTISSGQEGWYIHQINK